MNNEWTAESIAWVKQEFPQAWQHKLADEHNAALESAKRESAKEIAAAWDKWQCAEKAFESQRQQLAAERELRERLILSWTLSKSDNQQLRDQRDEAIRLLECKEKQLAVMQATMRRIDSELTGSLPVTNLVKEICRSALSGDTTALDAAIEQKRLEIWAKAPDQPDIQEAVIKKLDLVHRHAIAAAQKPLADALYQIGLLAGSYRGDPPQVKLEAIMRRCERELAKAKEGK